MMRVGPSNWLKSGSDKQGEMRQDRAGVSGTSRDSGCTQDGYRGLPNISTSYSCPPLSEILHLVQITSSGKPSMITCSKTHHPPQPTFLRLHLCPPAIYCLDFVSLKCACHKSRSVLSPSRGQSEGPHRMKFPHRGGVSTWGVTESS